MLFGYSIGMKAYSCPHYDLIHKAFALQLHKLCRGYCTVLKHVNKGIQGQIENATLQASRSLVSPGILSSSLQTHISRCIWQQGLHYISIFPLGKWTLWFHIACAERIFKGFISKLQISKYFIFFFFFLDVMKIHASSIQLNVKQVQLER